MSKRKLEENVETKERIAKRNRTTDNGGLDKKADPASGVVSTTSNPKETPGEDASAQKAARKQARKQAKRERRRLGDKQKGQELSKSESREEKQKRFHSSWKVSNSVGGYLLNLDPVFSKDEKHLILAKKSSVLIYSTLTSLLVRTIQTSRSSHVSGFALSPKDPSHLYISTNSGSIDKWNWVDGGKLGKWSISSQIYGLAVLQTPSPQRGNDTVYTIDKKEQWRITAHCLWGRPDADKTELHTLLKSPDPFTALKVLDGGKIIVASSGKRLTIGHDSNSGNVTLKKLSYVWREIQCPEWITSVGIHIPDNSHNTHDQISKARVKSIRSVDIAIGGLNGLILVYRDILEKLIQNQRPHNKGLFTSQRLHWHRNEVVALQWSADGNYLISGGYETVLVLWQLETGKKQFLPHLSAPVKNVLVSPSGSSYAIILADNSAMVISTAELQPTFSIQGISTPISIKDALPSPHVPTVNNSQEDSTTVYLPRTPAIVSPLSSEQLLLAVPAPSGSQSGYDQPSGGFFLQSLDARTGNQTSCQALTRTNTTTHNIGPEGNRIQAPQVTHLAVSTDAQWLVTVDEWMPPQEDLRPFFLDADLAEEQLSRLETHLNFWSWNEAIKSWELSSKVDNPHSEGSGMNRVFGRVFNLISNPAIPQFVTIGDDGFSRSWEPRKRTRNGIQVRDLLGKPLFNWRCRAFTALHLVNEGVDATKDHIISKLAFSADGSLLVASLPYSSQSTSLYMINHLNNKVERIHSSLISGYCKGLGIVFKYMVVLSDDLVVWDLVMGCVQFKKTLNDYGLSANHRLGATYLAVDQAHQTYAVAIPTITKSSHNLTRRETTLTIHDPEEQDPAYCLFETSIPGTLTALLPMPSSTEGYYTINSAAELRTVTHTSTISTRLSPEPLASTATLASAPALSGLETIYGTGSTEPAATLLAPDGADDATDSSPSQQPPPSSDHRIHLPHYEPPPVLHQHQLTELFDSINVHATSVEDMFLQVARLVVGRRGENK